MNLLGDYYFKQKYCFLYHYIDLYYKHNTEIFIDFIFVNEPEPENKLLSISPHRHDKTLYYTFNTLLVIPGADRRLEYLFCYNSKDLICSTKPTEEQIMESFSVRKMLLDL